MDPPLCGAARGRRRPRPIAGFLGAYLLLYPHARSRTLVGFGLLIFTRLSAGLVIGAWFLLQFIPGIAAIHQVGGVAHFAHVGGFVTGFLLAVAFRPRVPSVPTLLPPRYP